MLIQQFFVGDGISHLSYLVAGSSKAVVIDPKRDVGDYIKIAKELGVEIEAVLVTHLHADFIGGHYELAEKTGAKLYLPAKQQAKRNHIPVKEGDVIEIENIKIEVLDTPGHTPEHVSYLFYDKTRGQDPWAVFTGDTLFVGDVGRPDLFPDKKEELASLLFDSIQKLMKIPDFVEVYPAHSAGTLCGKALSTKRTTTIGYEKRFNPLLSMDKERFIKTLLEDMPPAPTHFKRCSKINEEGSVYLSEFPPLKSLSIKQFESLCQDKTIIDARHYLSWVGGHIPNSLSMDYKHMPFSLFAGWILDPSKEVILITDTPQDADQVALKLRRVGIDNVIGYLEGDTFAWAKSGRTLKSLKSITAQDLDQWIKEDKDFIILDLRSLSERKSGFMPNSVHIPLPTLSQRYNELDKNKEIVLVCGLGPRGALGAGILEQLGFEKLIVLAGGMNGWNNYKNSQK